MTIARLVVDLNWSGATGSPGVNVWHLRFDQTEPGAGDVESLSGIINDFYTACAGMFPSTLEATCSGDAIGLLTEEGNVYTSPAWGVAGSGGPNFLPPANAMYVNWQTSSGGRNGKGRTFIGPLIAASNEGNGTPDEAFRDDLQDAADALVSASLLDLNGAVVVFSRTESIARDFTSALVPNKFGVLRSRRD